MEGKDDLTTSLRPSPVSPPPVFKKRTGVFRWAVVILIGLLILFAGSVWVIFATWNPPPSASDYSSYSEYQKALHGWKNASMEGNFYGRLVMDIGAFFMIIAGILGYVDPSVDIDERRFLVAMAIVGVFVFLVVSVGFFQNSPYTS